jgi:hypothetical protein
MLRCSDTLCCGAAPCSTCTGTPQDKSWRVRYNVAMQLVALCEALGPDVTR